MGSHVLNSHFAAVLLALGSTACIAVMPTHAESRPINTTEEALALCKSDENECQYASEQCSLVERLGLPWDVKILSLRGGISRTTRHRQGDYELLIHIYPICRGLTEACLLGKDENILWRASVPALKFELTSQGYAVFVGDPPECKLEIRDALGDVVFRQVFPERPKVDLRSWLDAEHLAASPDGRWILLTMAQLESDGRMDHRVWVYDLARRIAGSASVGPHRVHHVAADSSGTARIRYDATRPLSGKQAAHVGSLPPDFAFATQTLDLREIVAQGSGVDGASESP